MELARRMEKQLSLAQCIFAVAGLDMQAAAIGIDKLPEIMGFALETVILIIFKIVDCVQCRYFNGHFGYCAFIYSVFHRMLQKDKYMRRSCNDILS